MIKYVYVFKNKWLKVHKVMVDEEYFKKGELNSPKTCTVMEVVVDTSGLKHKKKPGETLTAFKHYFYDFDKLKHTVLHDIFTKL